MFNYNVSFKEGQDTLLKYLDIVNLGELSSNKLLKELDNIEDIRDWVYSNKIYELLDTKGNGVKTGTSNTLYKLISDNSQNQLEYIKEVVSEDLNTENIFQTKVNFNSDIGTLVIQQETEEYLIRMIATNGNKTEVICYMIKKSDKLKDVKVKQLLMPRHLIVGKTFKFKFVDNYIGIELEVSDMEDDTNNNYMLDDGLEYLKEDKEKQNNPQIKRDINYYKKMSNINNLQEAPNQKEEDNKRIYKGYVGEQLLKQRRDKDWEGLDLEVEEEGDKESVGKFKPNFMGKGLKRRK